MYVCHTNIKKYLDFTVCHMSILFYQFANRIDGISHNNCFRMILFKLTYEITTASFGLTNPVIFSGLGLFCIFNNRNEQIDALLLQKCMSKFRSKSSQKIMHKLILFFDGHENIKLLNNRDNFRITELF